MADKSMSSHCCLLLSIVSSVLVANDKILFDLRPWREALFLRMYITIVHIPNFNRYIHIHRHT